MSQATHKGQPENEPNKFCYQYAYSQAAEWGTLLPR